VSRKQVGKQAKTRQPGARETEADLIFHSGKIYTVDRQRRWAEAVAVKDGKILAVGSDKTVRRFRGSHTQIVDLAGRMAMPGLVDVHNHHTRGGQLDLYEVSFP
jgi:predicted amidohydrolase YtcJ